MTTKKFLASQRLDVLNANREIERKLHQSVSNQDELNESQDGASLIVDDFAGRAAKGEIEAVVGFDSSHAVEEIVEVQTTPAIAENLEDLESLPDAATLSYLQVETVCGNDDRVRISLANDTPWRRICKLIITYPNGSRYVGTGWFIGSRTVMTAGHCLHSRELGWAKSIEVIPGMDAARRPYGSQTGTTFRATLGWTRDAKPDYDYGAIILPDDTLGKRVGWFGFTALSDSELQNLLVNNSGYPADKPAGTQWFNAGGINRVERMRIYYMFDTMGGQSGSPVWRKDNSKRHAVGIHAYGGCPNSATRITTEVFNNMLQWRDNP